ncbi:hypothetical protein [Kiloniella majae]|uniref:hypothetical protein n=1 Tax=Kiloniella majae TaxID=1938558 RepID=UPI000A2777AC|nr:hypothetical protein [Kiloniella majae]
MWKNSANKLRNTSSSNYLGIVFGIILIGLISNAKAETYTLYSYHPVPPFITGENQGLTYELVQELESLSKGQHSFNIQVVPRKRLNELIKTETIIVLWANPRWFKEIMPSQTFWSDRIMLDTSVYVWEATNTKSYKSPNDLIGASFGGIKNYKYNNIEVLLTKKQARRTDADNDWQLTQMLLSGRIDVAIMLEINACNLIKKHQLFEKINLAEHNSFDRKVMLTGVNDKGLIKLINKLQRSPRWAARLANYRAKIVPIDQLAPGDYCSHLPAPTTVLNN